MKIKIIDKQKFFERAEFFKQNLGFVYNFDDYEHLKQSYQDELTPENFEDTSQIAYENVFNGYVDAFIEAKNRFLVIAEENDKIYSIATFEQVEPEAGDNFEMWFISGVTTRHTHRRQGFSQSVLKTGIKKVKSVCYFTVHKENQNAIALYEKLGFQKMKRKNLENEKTSKTYLMAHFPKKIKKQTEQTL